MIPTPGQRLLMWLLPLQQTGTHRTGGTYRLGTVTFIVEYDKDDGDGSFVTIRSLSAARPGTGEGHQVLSLICGMADIFGVALDLYARAMDHRPPTTVRLIRFYERHGFHMTQDHGCDWQPDPDEGADEDHVGVDMQRRPRGR